MLDGLFNPHYMDEGTDELSVYNISDVHTLHVTCSAGISRFK